MSLVLWRALFIITCTLGFNEFVEGIAGLWIGLIVNAVGYEILTNTVAGSTELLNLVASVKLKAKRQGKD